ncbi:hypothetical protein AB1Y20_015871 [Prymnesium parvum]|uniref:Uncharacterized protein n=1 Tax=Prymnesium parvum TaxID=97485 RepID=A0AB34K264_PRYPA
MARRVATAWLLCAACAVDGLARLPASTPALAPSRVCPAMSAGRRPAWGWASIAAAVCAGAAVGVPSSARVEGGGGSVVQRLVGARPAAAAPSVASGISAKRLKMAFKAKLAKVPVFLVTNEGGSPFLSTLSGGDQSALLFLFPSDAQRMLAGVMKAPNAASSGAKVLPSNLDRAFKLAQLPPTISGLRDQVTGRELKMVWQFMPHAGETRAAQAILVTKGKVQAPRVPAYMIDGLVYKKRGREVRPVFLCKRDLDAAVAQLGDALGKRKVIVVDLLGFLLQLQEDIEEGVDGIEAELKSLELVPPSESLAFREQIKKAKAPIKARIIPPDHSGGR